MVLVLGVLLNKLDDEARDVVELLEPYFENARIRILFFSRIGTGSPPWFEET